MNGTSCTQIRLMHISDLHFGSDHGFFVQGGTPEPGIIEKDLAQVLIDDLKSEGEAPFDGLIISGDLMTHARWVDDLGDALLVLSKLVGELGLRKDQVYIIPGNHDYEWYKKSKGKFERVMLKADQKANFSHEVHYRNFLRRFYGEERAITGESFDILGDHFKVKIGLLDSV